MDPELLCGEYGTYSIEKRRPFAFGAVSVLYKGADGDGHLVCIKVFRDVPESGSGDDALDEFVNEIEAQCQLKHQNILPILDYGRHAKHEPGPFIVYPYCMAGTLRNVIMEKPYLPVAEALVYLEQIAMAVDHAHSCGFIHGDLKPENVLFEYDRSRALLADFGMSRYFPRTIAITTATGGGGTPAYLSPEQIADGEQSPRSDIYSLGLIAHELFTGRLPFDLSAPAFRQMQAKVDGRLGEPRDANPDLSDTVVSALRSALELNRYLRPKTAAEFCRMLRGETAPTVPDAPNTKGWWSSHNDKIKIAFITAVVAGAATIAVALIEIAPELMK